MFHSDNRTGEVLQSGTLTHCGRVTQICVFNTVKLGTSLKFSLVPLHKGECFQSYHTLKHYQGLW